MKRSNWKLGALATLAVAASTFFSQAQAAFVTLSFAPQTITNPGDSVAVDIVVDGLDVATGGFSLELDYDNLTFVDYQIGGPGGTMGDPMGLLDLSPGNQGGTVSLAAFADLSLDAADLYAAQNSGGPFTLARVNFTGVKQGNFTLNLRDVALSDFLGVGLVVCTGAACVDPNPVPEPMAPLLLATALGALALTRRGQRKAA